MGLNIVTAPTLEPITLAEAKAHCRVDTSDDDALLGVLIQAARAKAEGMMHAAIMQRTVDQTLDAFPEAEIEIALPPACNGKGWNPGAAVAAPLAVTSIGYVDTAGAAQTLLNTTYTLDTSSWPYWVLPAVDTEWPATRAQANAVTLRYTTGYDAVAKVPGDIRAWLLLTVAFLYANREALVLGGRVEEIPGRFTDSLLDPYTVWRA